MPAPPAPGTSPAERDATRRTLIAALALALGAAVSLGLARFSYALLLPPMRADLGWSYFTAGAMNTLNAAGYLAGALAAPWLMRRFGARAALIGGSLLAAVLLALHGFVRAEAALYALRLGTGMASAAVFVAGGLMAARLGNRPDLGPGITPSLVLGLYYGGTGMGIVASALLVPPLVAWPLVGGSGWAGAWIALAALAAVATLPMVRFAHDGAAAPALGAAAVGRARLGLRPFAFGLAGYFMFGLGYIGYMTFIVTLLREQLLATGTVVAFYAVLGLGVMASPWLWARLLQRSRGGQALALLNALLAVATALPVLWPHAAVAFVSGALFGGVFLSVVASTTALVRHNLPPAAWPAGISAFTIVFAFGQIVGPSLVGRLADGPGGLRMGLLVSAAALLLGALLASRQRPLS
ncbi:MAG: YbfB/YjiJ family MFS transporter [Ideonella sp.]|nr:YbfB/YjiJ family MFS transporter [Ideonella sp.]